MLRISTTKAIATLAVILVGLMLAVPSFFSAEQRTGFVKSLPSWFPTWIVPTRAIVLGLDLQGGSQIVLEVDRNDLMRSMSQGRATFTMEFEKYMEVPPNIAESIIKN